MFFLDMQLDRIAVTALQATPGAMYRVRHVGVEAEEASGETASRVACFGSAEDVSVSTCASRIARVARSE